MSTLMTVTCDGCGNVLRDNEGDREANVDLSISDMGGSKHPGVSEEDEFISWDLCRACAVGVRDLLVARYGRPRP